MLVEFGLLAKALGITAPARVESTARAVGRVCGAPLALLIVKRVGKVHPEAAVVFQDPPDIVEDSEEVPDEVVGVRLMAEFSHPAVRPGQGVGAVVPEEVEGGRGSAHLDRAGLDPT
jgi:hypothetical protein